MSQHDFDIANQTAPNARADINNALQALASLSAGASAPATTYANMLWYDSSNNILKMRSEADDAWISIAYMDQTANAYRILDNTQVVDTGGTQTGLLGDQATSAWETGTGTTESLVSPAKIKAAIESLGRIEPPTAGTTYLIKRVQESAFGNGGLVGSGYPFAGLQNGHDSATHLGVTCLVPGTITCYFEHRAASAFGVPISSVRIVKNGTQLAEWTNSSTSFVARSLNVSVALGDTVAFQHRYINDDSVEWRNLRIYSNTNSFAVA